MECLMNPDPKNSANMMMEPGNVDKTNTPPEKQNITSEMQGVEMHEAPAEGETRVPDVEENCCAYPTKVHILHISVFLFLSPINLNIIFISCFLLQMAKIKPLKKDNPTSAKSLESSNTGDSSSSSEESDSSESSSSASDDEDAGKVKEEKIKSKGYVF